ncbi:MAG TPA: hypothetical protein VKZ18_14255 [Polyangia bacterium]|nr:hypothetical protein [Polyangia bacterium]
MRILFRKLSRQERPDERHELTLLRPDGRRESTLCETRSVLMHDFIHYAVEGAAGIETGFWGRLAAGRTLADMNDRAGLPSADEAAQMATIERFVGALSGAAKGVPAAALAAGIARYAEATDERVPPWLTEATVIEAQERLRRIVGAWRAAPSGAAIELDWPPAEGNAPARVVDPGPAG